MLEYDFENSVGHWVWLTAHRFQRAMNSELQPHGITFRQAQVLFRLALDGQLSQVQLADRLNLEPASLVPVLDRMERDGLLTRQNCSEDRRRKIIKLQPKAETVWETIVACARRVRKRATRGMTAGQVRTLNELLSDVVTNLTPAKPTDEVEG